MLRKITYGWVTQQYDPAQQRFVSQEFSAGDEYEEYEDETGEAVDAHLFVDAGGRTAHLTLDMVQPDDMLQVAAPGEETIPAVVQSAMTDAGLLAPAGLGWTRVQDSYVLDVPAAVMRDIRATFIDPAEGQRPIVHHPDLTLAHLPLTGTDVSALLAEILHRCKAADFPQDLWYRLQAAAHH